jgi:hypothetical protein
MCIQIQSQRSRADRRMAKACSDANAGRESDFISYYAVRGSESQIRSVSATNTIRVCRHLSIEAPQVPR